MSDRRIRAKIAVDAELTDRCDAGGPLDEMAALEQQDIADFLRERYELPGVAVFERFNVTVELVDI